MLEDPTRAPAPEVADDDQPDPRAGRVVGVGPWPGGRECWPDDPRLDPELLAEGDRRNVEDRFRYWSNAAIVAELDRTRQPLHVAVENWQHDANIGSVVRTANAVNAAGVHVVGRRRWNRRGAMVTDRYLSVHHHDGVAGFAEWARAAGLVVVGIDNVPGSVPLETYDLPREAVLLFGQEGPGLSEEALGACVAVLSIAQFGSTRSINVGAAAAVAMHAWVRRHVFGQSPVRDPGL
ncbi:tRNA G18 (ribose-2'-O)-methylase SpoU [Kineococcus xinjiangensis]|uniref:tRNA G18 (Ribose-2'-O)-methylase SpoU n=1 Tax=Kineococcus xinjiangensis TaxID=512762 RepID=A0A2S6IUL1_9ACTN|nr:TrmH family RNA methyltransferase [Kineococcus xinjiangensis]PPK97960.1 tRNA G18 (ribose-2'-O)-methylase SpoU [Kineococcus xinjiangensis]